MKLPRAFQNLLLVLGSLTLVVLVVESASFFLVRINPFPPYHEVSIPGDFWNFDDVKASATMPGRKGDIARLIIAEKYEGRRLNHSPTTEEQSLFSEAPLYLASDKQRPLWSGRHRVSPNLDENFKLLGSQSKKVKYEVHYTTDEYGRRKAQPAGKRNVLFLGCSLTFGQGLNDEETFPFLVGKKLGWRTYNAGIPGVSPTAILQRLNEGTFPGPLTEDETTVVVTVIPDHIGRTIGTMSLFRTHKSALRYYPQAYLENEQVKIRSTFGEDPTFMKPALEVLAHSNFTKAFQLDYPPLRDEHFHLMAKIFVEIESRLQKRYPKMKHFVVGFFPSGHSRVHYRQLRDALVREKIKVFDYTFIHGPNLLDTSFVLKYDGHPSPLANEFYSDLLIYDLTKL